MKASIIILLAKNVISSIASIVLHLSILRVRIKARRHARKIIKTIEEVERGKTGKSFEQFLNEL